jgi:Spy/CpxP family protein refolding chaperone
MKRLMMTVIAVALLAPLTLMAQDAPPDKPFGGKGHGQMMGQGHGQMMGQGHGNPHGGDCGSMGERRGMKRRGGGIRHLLMMADKIGLTDEQRDQLKSMQTEFQLDRIDRKAELQKATLKLRNLKRDPDASEGDVMGAIDEVSRLKAEMQKAGYKHHKLVKSVLTDEQTEKLKELRKAHGGMGMGMGKQGHGMKGRCGGGGRP